jgi:hypothetical protein
MFTSVADAMQALPELKLPVLLIGIGPYNSGFAVRARTEKEFGVGVQKVLFCDSVSTLVVTGDGGDDPRREPTAAAL